MTINLTTTHYAALSILQDCPLMSSWWLKKVGFTIQQDLLSKGLVETTRGGSSVVYVAITPKGKKKLGKYPR